MTAAHELIKRAIYLATDAGQTIDDERRFAAIEALLRDVLGQDHGVWRWRVCQLEGDEQDVRPIQR